MQVNTEAKPHFLGCKLGSDSEGLLIAEKLV